MTGKTVKIDRRDAPWSLRGVEPEQRAKANYSARKAGMPVGKWVSRAIDNAATSEIKEGRALDKTGSQREAELFELVQKAVSGLDTVNQRLATIEAQQRPQRQQPEGFFSRLFHRSKHATETASAGA